MKKLLIGSILTSLLFTVVVEAQITYESSDFTSIGENYPVVNVADASVFDFSQTGANYSWNFSELSTAEPVNFGYEDPNNSPFKNTWCLFHLYIFNCNSMFNENFNLGSSLGENLTLGEYSFNDVYQHAYKSNTEFQIKMIAGNINLGGTNLPGILEFQDPDVMLKFPINYNETYTDNSSIDMDFTDLGVDLVVTATGIRTNVVEGWGALSIPNHTFSQTLKVKSTNVQFFNIYYEGQHNEIPLTTITYSWFDKEYGIPVLMVNGTEVEGEFTPASVSYIHFDSMNVQDISDIKSLIYPNPTSGKIQVILSDNEQIESVQVMDYSGKIIGRNLNLSNYPKGSYMLRIQTNKRIISEKVIRK